MFKPFLLFGRAISLWWRELISFMLLNILWLALQITIIAGPPATAAMYAAARRVVDGDYLDLRHYWDAMRQMFWPAWKWGAVNLVIVVVVAGNFWFYRNSSSSLIALLRLFWAANAAQNIQFPEQSHQSA